MTTTITPSQLLQTQPGADTRTSVKSDVVAANVAPVRSTGGQGEDHSSLSLSVAKAAGASTGPVFDRARVDALRTQVDAGQYRVDANAIADALLAQSSSLQGLG
ncbi:MAG: flagellar biosynthesis anti-sigma factor FlgM [Nevskiaceae bacterium]|nr:MAG: flagellar biosynthesis anti-sigma factor FlgM [Nevskiaceae bacterium]TBR71552.1 MAG: flagellar biosynthesis anti-sigma factor FlgM [Nevskiaceae bacterium]